MRSPRAVELLEKGRRTLAAARARGIGVRRTAKASLLVQWADAFWYRRIRAYGPTIYAVLEAEECAAYGEQVRAALARVERAVGFALRRADELEGALAGIAEALELVRAALRSTVNVDRR